MGENSKIQVIPHKLFDILQSFQKTEALKSAVELDVFSAINEGGSSVGEIAAHSKTSIRGMRVLCDYLCLIGLIQKQLDRYWLTDEAALYLDRRSHQFIAEDAIQVYGGGTLAEGFRHLAEAVRIGGTALPQGGTMVPEHPYWVQFARAIAPIGAANAKLLAELLEYSPSVPMRVLDVACGHGHYGVAIAKLNPMAEIFAQDWLAVLEFAIANAQDAGVSERYHTLPGDVFNTSLGESYDLVLLTNFLPDLGPSDCERLLVRIRSTLNKRGRVIAVQAIPENDRLLPPNAPSLALSLLVQTPQGDVYTSQELTQMFRRAGFGRIETRELGSSSAHVLSASQPAKETPNNAGIAGMMAATA